MTGRLAPFIAALVVVASVPLAAQAQGGAAPVASASANRLFGDSQMVTLDRLSVEVVGAGPDVVLIPGLASSRETFRRTAERLRGRYRLHLVQVAGFAGEPARANASGPVIGPTTEALDAYIVRARLRKPAIVGHSLGGVIALELTQDHPGDVGRVMTVDTLAFYSELFAGPQATAQGAKPFADSIGAKMLASSDAEFAQFSAQSTAALVTAPADQARLQAWAIASARPTFVKAMQEDMVADLRPKMGAITVPVTVIYEAPLAALIQADYAPVKNKTLVAARAGALHFIMFDDPQGFDAVLDAFLKG